MNAKTVSLTIIVLVSIVVASAVASAGQQRTAAVTAAQANSRAEVTQTVNQIQGDLVSLDKSQQSYREAAEKVGALYADLGKKIDVVVRASGAITPGKSDAAAISTLQAAIKDMQQTQAAYNAQFLQLQQKMQNENRQYTTVSNVMKTKHDTVKNSINNVR